MGVLQGERSDFEAQGFEDAYCGMVQAFVCLQVVDNIGQEQYDYVDGTQGVCTSVVLRLSRVFFQHLEKKVVHAGQYVP